MGDKTYTETTTTHTRKTERPVEVSKTVEQTTTTERTEKKKGGMTVIVEN